MNILVTAWYLDTGAGLEFNHISDGYNENHKEPYYFTEYQGKLWKNGKWIGKKATLENNNLIIQKK
ncbi:MAG: hypothetical protein JWP44_5011 [Mucilaginibacter sp.]|nr:hypothetical protein [Mucilaginibacter sp.]